MREGASLWHFLFIQDLVSCFQPKLSLSSACSLSFQNYLSEVGDTEVFHGLLCLSFLFMQRLMLVVSSCCPGVSVLGGDGL